MSSIYKAKKLGIQQFDYSVDEIREYIDWTPFFYTWEMKKEIS